MSFKNCVLEASGLDFGGPEARFRRVLGPFFRDLALLAGKIAGTDFELKAKAAQFQLGAQVGRSSDFYIEVRPRCSRREGGRRCPPPGGFRLNKKFEGLVNKRSGEQASWLTSGLVNKQSG